jgi:ribosomal protein S18 acetylase RimI-like enzyme
MDDATLRERLWLGFARLQALLGGRAAQGEVIRDDRLVASFVPNAPDSPTLNAIIALADELDASTLDGMRNRYEQEGIRRWGVWTDSTKRTVIRALQDHEMRLTSSSPGMATTLDDFHADGAGPARRADLATVGHVNDLAYGNPDGRLEKTLAPLPSGLLHAYRADHRGRPASVALALHHDEDCGVSFVATAPFARRQGLATDVMRRVAVDAQEAGCTSATLQATNLGEKLYKALGYRKVSDMQLWERRP